MMVVICVVTTAVVVVVVAKVVAVTVVVLVNYDVTVAIGMVFGRVTFDKLVVVVEKLMFFTILVVGVTHIIIELLL